MKEKLKKLIDVKSIVTLMLTMTLVVILIMDGTDSDAMTIFTSSLSAVMTYFFTRKEDKNENN